MSAAAATVAADDAYSYIRDQVMPAAIEVESLADALKGLDVGPDVISVVRAIAVRLCDLSKVHGRGGRW